MRLSGANRIGGNGTTGRIILFVSFSMACAMLVIIQNTIPSQIENLSPESSKLVKMVAPTWSKALRSQPWKEFIEDDIKDQLEHAFDSVDEKIFSDENMEKKLPNTDEPIVYFITPTYYRDTQMVDLVRLSQTLMLDGRIYWILIEDRDTCTKRIRDLLDRTGLPYAHVAVPTPTEISKEKKHHRGVPQRNRGIDIILSLTRQGIVYFGDDDNGYDIRLFPEIRKTRYVSVFNIAYVGGGSYERCVTEGDKVSHLVTNWRPGRKFPIDMGGIAFNKKAIDEKRPKFDLSWPLGFLETNFVAQIIDSVGDMQPLNEKCRMILAWHVKTQSRGQKEVLMDKSEYDIIKNGI